jgi:hypothetical protein
VDSTAVTPDLIFRAVFEFLFLVVLVVGFLLLYSNLRKRLFALGAGALVVLYVFLGAWAAVQMLDRWQYDYPQKVSFIPLTRFAMYQAQVKESVQETYSWQATLADGTSREVNIAKEFSTIGLPPLSTRMRVLLNWAQEDADTVKHAKAEVELKDYAKGLVASLASHGVDATKIGFYEVTGTPQKPVEKLLMGWTAAEVSER